MTDFEVAYQITDTIALFLNGFAVISTVIFAYITGAFYFLHRAPLITRVVSFLFLLTSIFFLMINMIGAFLHFLAVIEQMEYQSRLDGASALITASAEGRTRTMAYLGFWTFVPVVIGTVGMCFWMTFFWKPDKSALSG